jgi:branched-chain amino acid transport system permease protein
MAGVILQQLFNGLISGIIYVLIGLGLTFLFGVMNVLNFAHGSVAVFGAYVTLWFMTRHGMPFVPAMLAAGAVAAIVGYALEQSMFRWVRDVPVNGLIVSIGLISVFETGLLAAFTSTPQSVPPQFTDIVTIGPVSLAGQRLFVLGITLVFLAVAYVLLSRTQIGRAIRATAQQPLAAELMGLNVNRIHAVTFAVCCMLASFAGSLFATLFTFTPLSGADIVLKAFVVVILGGLGSLPGAVVGGLLLGVTEALGTQFLSSDYQSALLFGILLVVLLVRPHGIFGVRERQA